MGVLCVPLPPPFLGPLKEPPWSCVRLIAATFSAAVRASGRLVGAVVSPPVLVLSLAPCACSLTPPCVWSAPFFHLPSSMY